MTDDHDPARAKYASTIRTATCACGCIHIAIYNDAGDVLADAPLDLETAFSLAVNLLKKVVAIATDLLNETTDRRAH